MKFALLGAEPDVVSLLAAIQSAPEHNLVAAYEAHLANTGSKAPIETAPIETASVDPTIAKELERNLGTAITEDAWESLLLGSIADAVIVCRDADNPDRRAEQLRKLTQESVPIIVMHPIGEAVLAFELLMIGQDSDGFIVPYQPEMDHLVMTGLFGTGVSMEKVQQLSVERRLADQSSEAVREQFARDAIYVRQLMGRIDQINALAATQDRTNYNGLSVQMSDQYSAVARWALLPSSEDGSQWTVHRESGTVTVETQADPAQWQIDTVANSSQTSVEAAGLFLDRFAEDLKRHQESNANSESAAPSRPDWDDACRAIELVENVDISRRRKKTISLYYEDISEENTFKSLMAAGGCLMLILVTLLLPALAAVESIIQSASDYSAPHDERVSSAGASGGGTGGADADEFKADEFNGPSAESPFLIRGQRPRRDLGWFGKWPLLMFLVLAFFISLQFLRLATRSNASDGRDRSPPAPSS